MSDYTISIRDGHVSFVYDDGLVPLLDVLDPDWQQADGGSTVRRRVSHVEPAPGGWTADMGPVGGPVLGPYPLRAEALAAERAWLTEHMGL